MLLNRTMALSRDDLMTLAGGGTITLSANELETYVGDHVVSIADLLRNETADDPVPLPALPDSGSSYEQPAPFGSASTFAGVECDPLTVPRPRWIVAAARLGAALRRFGGWLMASLRRHRTPPRPQIRAATKEDRAALYHLANELHAYLEPTQGCQTGTPEVLVIKGQVAGVFWREI